MREKINFSQIHISIHASRGGSDCSMAVSGTPAFYFNPRFPRGKRRAFCACDITYIAISIHASRGGSDLASRRKLANVFSFQSTLPAGEATFFRAMAVRRERNFNPRFPRGKRRILRIHLPQLPVISIHASRGGSDSASSASSSATDAISIHASRGGSDQLTCLRYRFRRNFNPRFPRGKRLL